MYRNEPYTGADLPSKFLCLTYDDGPGKHTYEIAKFLYFENIQATFFVVGKYAFHHQDILEKVSKLGHLVGNHTYDHPDMPYYLSVNGDVNSQILKTDVIIKKNIPENMVYFRSPYGKWSPEVADELNMNILSTLNHIGPIHWDVGGVDCFYWKNEHSVEDVVNKYLKDIKEKGRGIVVMHDEIADMNYLKDSNNTLELTKQLIPKLKLQGYKFVRLDQIESIKNDAFKPLKFTLKSASGKFVTLSKNENNIVNVDGKQDSILNEISIVDLGHGKIALKASNDFFFSLRAEKGNVIGAIGKEVNENETFDLIPFSFNRIALRAFNGNYVAVENKQGGRLLASKINMRECERFSFSPIGIKVKKNITLSKRYKTIKRQMLYIRSKIRQGIYK